METIRALILRLQQQSDQQAIPSELLATVNQLQSALQQALTEPVRQVRSGNISVVFPSGNRLHTPLPQLVAEKQSERVSVKEVVQASPEAADSGQEVGQAPKLRPASEFGPAREVGPASEFRPAPESRPASPTKLSPEPEPAVTELVSVAENFHLSF
ncbi:MAG: hypothetical protein ABI151_16040, partial [Chitinophagaceae bacterium]